MKKVLIIALLAIIPLCVGAKQVAKELFSSKGIATEYFMILDNAKEDSPDIGPTNHRGFVATNINGLPFLSLYDSSGKRRLALGVAKRPNGNEDPFILFFDRNGNQTILSLNEEGTFGVERK